MEGEVIMRAQGSSELVRVYFWSPVGISFFKLYVYVLLYVWYFLIKFKFKKSGKKVLV